MRAATAARHAWLDSALPVSRPDAGLHEYRGHLRLLRDWLLPMAAWERGFFDGPQDPGRLPPCERVQWLLLDLHEVGESTIPRDAGLPWPRVANAAWRWGASYVVEGSQLGARVLLGRLQGRLGTHRPRLLAGAGENAGLRWRRFLQAFDAGLQLESDIDEACRGAQEVFDRVARLAGLESTPA